MTHDVCARPQIDVAYKAKLRSDMSWWAVDADNMKAMLEDMDADDHPCRYVQYGSLA